MSKRLIAVLLAAMMLMSVLAGCGTYTTPEEPAPEKTETAETAAPGEAAQEEAPADPTAGSGSVTFVYTEPNTLNMIQSASNLDTDVFYLISAMLYRPYDGGKYAELAEGYTVSGDNKTYTYTIKDAVYSDGTPIVAADFVYYLIGTLDATTAYYYKNGTAYVNGECDASELGIRVVDEKTFEVELENAIADFDPELEIYPLQQAFAEAKGEALGGTPADLMYSGPYILNEWVYGSYMTFTKNPTYINAADSFQIKDLKMIHSIDESGRYAMFESGEADMLLTVSENTYELIPDSCTHVITDAMQGLEFNTTGMMFDGTTFMSRDPEVTALLANQNFRMALSYAINREAIVPVVNPTGVASNRYVSPNAKGNTDTTLFMDDYAVESVPMSGDVEAAKAYLAAALEELGYSDVSELPTVKYLTFDSDMYRLMAETLQSEWKTILGLENIQIELKPVNDAVMSMVFMDYDIYYQSLSSSSRNFREFLEFWITGGTVSDVMQAGAPFSNIYSNAEFDALVNDAMFEFDVAARNAMMAQAEQIMLDSYIFVPIQFNGIYYAVNDRVQGYVDPGAQDGLMFNYATVAE